MFNIEVMNYLVISLVGRFLASMIGGIALLYIYKSFKKALKNKSRILLWWSFTQILFFLLLILFIFKGNVL